MFNSPVVRQSVRQGISAHNLPQFVGVIEHRAAETVQQYAALFPPGVRGADGARSTAAAPSPGGKPRSPYPSSPTGSASSFTMDAASSLLNQSAASFGPSEPAGLLKVHVRSSAMRAAMLDHDAGKDKDDDDADMPLSREEMKARAAAQLSKPSAIAARTAALAAAQVLTTKRPVTLTSTGAGPGGSKR